MQTRAAARNAIAAETAATMPFFPSALISPTVPRSESSAIALNSLSSSKNIVHSFNKISKNISTHAKLPNPSLSTKRKRGPSQAEKNIDHVVKDLDILPHIMATVEAHVEVQALPPLKKQVRRAKAVNGIKVQENNLNIIQSFAKKQKAKNNNYNLTYGISPYPDHLEPTPDSCKQVYQLLAEKHGEKERPSEIPPPSLQVAGCGAVPDVCDAILRTILSMTTKKENASVALEGLVAKFGVVESGPGKGSINWISVHGATQAEVKDAIKSGGLAERKSAYIKQVLDGVYEKNCHRRDQLVAKRDALDATDTVSPELIKTKIAAINEDLLSMNYLFEESTEDAMDELTSLAGVGVKTASCVLLLCMRRPSFAVDTHVFRICKWLGWVPDQKAITPNSTFSHCDVRVPDELKYGLHLLFWEHGRLCGRCKSTSRPGTEEWDKTICPIEQLVNRTGQGDHVKKLMVSGKGKQGKKGNKGEEAVDVENIEVGSHIRR